MDVLAAEELAGDPEKEFYLLEAKATGKATQAEAVTYFLQVSIGVGFAAVLFSAADQTG